jgi:hypothetical protein
MLSQPFIGGGVMTDFTREEIRSQLNMQGFDPPEPEFTEVVYRINALIESLKKLDDLDVYHIEPWPLMPYRGLPQRSVGQGSLAWGGAAESHDPNIDTGGELSKTAQNLWFIADVSDARMQV